MVASGRLSQNRMLVNNRWSCRTVMSMNHDSKQDCSAYGTDIEFGHNGRQQRQTLHNFRSTGADQ